MKLRPFQREGNRFIEQCNGRCIIADETGLGKSAQALTYAKKRKSQRPLLILCMNGLKANWENEIKLWMDEKERVCNISRSPNVKLKVKNRPDNQEKRLIWRDFITFKSFNPSIYIIHFDILFAWKSAILQLAPPIVIIDEAHLVLHYSAMRTKAARQIARKAKYIIGLTGTPIRNTNMDIFDLSKLINTKLFDNKKEYGIRYCNGRMGAYGWEFKGSSNESELHQICKTFMIRRTKKEVLKELPATSRITVPIELTNFDEYIKIEEDYLKWLFETKRPEDVDRAKRALVLTQFSALKQICIKGKMEAIEEWIDDYLYENEKLVCIAYHKETMRHLHQKYSDNSLMISGDIKKMSERNKAALAFQKEKQFNLIILQLQSAIGLNLHAADTTCHIEFGWVPADHLQGEGRVSRIGQKSRKGIFAYYLYAKNTIEEKIAGILNQKLSISEKVIDGKSSEELQGNLLIDVIADYIKKGSKYAKKETKNQ